MRHVKKTSWAYWVLGLVLLRGLVPAGFMLAPVDGSLAFVLCSADMPAAAMRGAAMPMSMSMPAGHQHGHAAQDHAAPGAHGDLNCPYAHSSGPAPLPTLAVLAGGTAFERPRVPAAVTQTLLAFGPIRQIHSRGPPRLV